jgi:hypothetical protein
MSSPAAPQPESESGALPAGERRRDPRLTVPWPAAVRDVEGHEARGEVIDVSLSGLKLRAEAQALRGEAVRLRVTLPRGGGEVDISARIVRRDADGIAVEFGRLAPAASDRLKPLLPTWELRRRAARVGIELPIRIEGRDGPTEGQTIDLSAFGGRVKTHRRLTPGDMVAVQLVPRDGLGVMSVRAVVWEADTQGGVLVFANLATTDFVRLRSYVDSLLPRPS